MFASLFCNWRLALLGLASRRLQNMVTFMHTHRQLPNSNNARDFPLTLNINTLGLMGGLATCLADAVRTPESQAKELAHSSNSGWHEEHDSAPPVEPSSPGALLLILWHEERTAFSRPDRPHTHLGRATFQGSSCCDDHKHTNGRCAASGKAGREPFNVGSRLPPPEGERRLLRGIPAATCAASGVGDWAGQAGTAITYLGLRFRFTCAVRLVCNC